METKFPPVLPAEDQEGESVYEKASRLLLQSFSGGTEEEWDGDWDETEPRIPDKRPQRVEVEEDRRMTPRNQAYNG